MKWFHFALVCCALLPAPLWGQELCDLTDSSIIELQTLDLAEVGGLLYAATGTAALRVLDATDPERLTVVEVVELATISMFVRTWGDLMVSGRTLLDVSVPHKPRVLSVIETVSGMSSLTDAGFGDDWMVVRAASKIAVYDIADPLHPALVGTWSGSASGGVEVLDDLIAVGGNQGITILRRQESGDPQALSTFAITGGVTDVQLKHGRLYAATPTKLWTFDITDPTNPIPLQTVPSVSTRLHLQAETLFAYGDVVSILDASGNAHPREIWRSSPRRVPYQSLVRRGSSIHGALGISGIETLSLDEIPDIDQVSGQLSRRFRHFVFDGHRLAAASLSGSTGGLATYDITNPATPIETSYQLTRNFEGVSTNGQAIAGHSGRWLYLHDLDPQGKHEELSRIELSGNIGHTHFHGNTLLAAVSGGIRVIDTSFPDLMFQIGEIDIANYVSTAYQPERALLAVLARYPSRIDFYDMAVPSAPVLVATFQFANEAISVARIKLIGDRAWVLAGNMLFAIDTTDLTSAQLIGSVPATGSTSSDLLVSERFVSVRSANQVSVFEFATSIQPVVSLRVAPLSKLVHIDDERLWFIEAEDQLVTFELVNDWGGSALNSIGSQIPFSLASQENLAFWIGYGGNLTIMDTNSVRVHAALPLPGSQRGLIAVANEMVYISTDDNQLLTMDVSDPSRPVLVAQQPAPAGRPIVTGQGLVIEESTRLRSYPFDASLIPGALADTLVLATPVQDIAVRGDVLYAACSRDGLHVIDASNPSDLFLRQTFVSMSDGASTVIHPVTVVALSDDRAYIGLSNAAGWILDISRPFVPVFIGTFPDEYRIRIARASGTLVAAKSSASDVGLLMYDSSDPGTLVPTLPDAQALNPSDFWLVGQRLISRLSTQAMTIHGLDGCPGECIADLAEPLGELNFFDVATFLFAFATQDPSADLAQPYGVWDFFDLGAYLAAFNAGCQE